MWLDVSSTGKRLAEQVWWPPAALPPRLSSGLIFLGFDSPSRVLLPSMGEAAWVRSDARGRRRTPSVREPDPADSLFLEGPGHLCTETLHTPHGGLRGEPAHSTLAWGRGGGVQGLGEEVRARWVRFRGGAGSEDFGFALWVQGSHLRCGCKAQV